MPGVGSKAVPGTHGRLRAAAPLSAVSRRQTVAEGGIDEHRDAVVVAELDLPHNGAAGGGVGLSGGQPSVTGGAGGRRVDGITQY
ncbi:hypothetical protein Ari01nite_86260 [Paractinoplanes rishiriensis]|uniref:Uncharacterized protein n=1 Tax=Paractinoplanes rishiriensis TaxID=1050105 RepID=A0A919K5A1_9ACTN|nr:hypothetical protein Ari01nite_86260 [Actinoplanes rishiriensis]